MDLIWWPPAAVLLVGSLLLLARIRVIDREIASTRQATSRLTAVVESGAFLTSAVARTETRRARTMHAFDRGSAPRPDRGPDRADG